MLSVQYTVALERKLEELASHIAVMRAGQFVEFGPAELILTEPQADYTLELLAAVPQLPCNPFV